MNNTLSQALIGWFQSFTFDMLTVQATGANRGAPVVWFLSSRSFAKSPSSCMRMMRQQTWMFSRRGPGWINC